MRNDGDTTLWKESFFCVLLFCVFHVKLKNPNQCHSKIRDFLKMEKCYIWIRHAGSHLQRVAMFEWPSIRRMYFVFPNASYLASMAQAMMVDRLAEGMDVVIARRLLPVQMDHVRAYDPRSFVAAVILCEGSLGLVVWCPECVALLAVVVRWRMVVHHRPFRSPWYPATRYPLRDRMVAGLSPRDSSSMECPPIWMGFWNKKEGF